MLEAETGLRVLNDLHGVMFYESEPSPQFALFSASFLRGVSQEQFERAFSHAVRRFEDPVAEGSAGPRAFQRIILPEDLGCCCFLMLVMAIEVLLEPASRSPAATAHVESLILATDNAGTLSCEEKASLQGSLRWLRFESINQTGRKLVVERLGNRKYLKRSAPAFFSDCYALRSRLVHGVHPFPSQNEISAVVAQLEVFVSDLVSGELLEIEL